jgi:nitroreductase
MSKLRSNRFVRKVLIWKKAWLWTRYFLRYSGLFPAGYDREICRARLRKEAHTIEKGLSLPSVRAGFGQSKIANLLRDIENAQKGGGLDGEVKIARDVLSSYVEWHRIHGYNASFTETLGEAITTQISEPTHGGVIAHANTISEQMTAHYDALVSSRRSVRNFSTEIVPAAEIEDAVRVAWSSPSVCNRQPWAIALVQSPEVVRALLGLQAGNRGFEQTITTLLVVLADTKAFVEDYEIFEPFVDAGMFSCALVNALHARNIGSCCLNLCVSHRVAERIVKVLDVQDHLFPVMMIACGYAERGAKVAMSTRGPSVVLRR